MPSTPYPISGTVSDNSSTLLNGVLVSVVNTESNEELTTTTNSIGEYAVDLANLTSGYTIGDKISVYASYGRYYDEEFHTTASSPGYGSVTLTLSTALASSAVYCSVTDIRNLTNVGSGEYSDTQLYMMIKMATSYIDQKTGRTWKGVQTVSNEYYDGKDTDVLDLAQSDIQTVTSVAIDDDEDGTYTAVTSTNSGTSSGCWIYGDEGYLILDKNSNITTFKANPKSVKVSYTYGNSKPTEDVKFAAMYLVSNMMKANTVYEKMANDIINRVRRDVRVGQ